MRWEKSKEDVIHILKPKLRHPLLIKHLLPRLKRPHYRIKLDALGSYTWELCDGERRVKEVGRLLRDRFGQSVEPLYERLALFLQSLEKNGFIQFEDLADKKLSGKP